MTGLTITEIEQIANAVRDSMRTAERKEKGPFERLMLPLILAAMLATGGVAWSTRSEVATLGETAARKEAVAVLQEQVRVLYDTVRAMTNDRYAREDALREHGALGARIDTLEGRVTRLEVAVAALPQGK